IANAFVFRLRHYDLHFNNLVAALTGVPSRRRTFFAQPQLFPAVSSGRNTDLRASVNCWDFDLGAERSFCNGNRNDSEKIVASTIKKRVRFDFHYDVEIARRAAMQSDVAAASDAHARTGLCAGRYAHIERFHARDAPFATAIAARSAEFSCSATTRTGDLETHLSAYLSYLAGSATGGANFLISRRDSRAVTHIANIQARKT